MEKLYFILGCTACGKGSLARELARRIGAEIISVDSMKIYRRMDIGTAKPAAEVRAEIPHHCVDLVEPSESFSVAQFVEHADAAVKQIRSAGNTPLAVGGTSLYIKALSEGLFEGPSASAEVREKLKARIAADGLAKLHNELGAVDRASAERIHPNDEKRIVRALEVFHETGQTISELQKQWDVGRRRYECVFMGLRREKEDQSHRINARVKKMIDTGLVEEVENLFNEPLSLSPQASQAVGYAEFIPYFKGECTLEKAIENIKINTRRLAKKQRTWHRRFANVKWFDLEPEEPMEKTVARILEKIDFS